MPNVLSSPCSSPTSSGAAPAPAWGYNLQQRRGHAEGRSGVSQYYQGRSLSGFGFVCGRPDVFLQIYVVALTPFRFWLFTERCVCETEHCARGPRREDRGERESSTESSALQNVASCECDQKLRHGRSSPEPTLSVRTRASRVSGLGRRDVIDSRNSSQVHPDPPPHATHSFH